MASVAVVVHDLTTMVVDVVVNAANERLRHGGGVAAALADAGGPAVQAASDDWVASHGPVGVGQAAVTTAGDLSAGHIVHVVGPRHRGRDRDPDDLAAAVIAALDAAADLGAQSVGMPAISCGVFGYPVGEATRIIAVTAHTWAATHPDVAMAISLVGHSEQMAAALSNGLDDHDPLAGWPGSGPGRRDRPTMPDGYGVPEDDDGLQDWEVVEAKLARASQVWLATTWPDGRPHVVPRWGVWLDNHLYYDGAPSTRHVRNLVANPAVALHLESGTDVVIVNGTGGPTSPPATWLAVQVAAAMGHKYGDKGYRPGIDSWAGEAAGGLCCLEPRDALAWTSFPSDVTRWRFD